MGCKSLGIGTHFKKSKNGGRKYNIIYLVVFLVLLDTSSIKSNVIYEPPHRVQHIILIVYEYYY